MMRIQEFWKFFSNKDSQKTISAFDALSISEKTAVFSELFQKVGFADNPMVISVLYRELHEGKTFEDFHAAWFPPKNYCHEIKEGAELFQQVFPVPTRVYNAINMNNPNEIISVGFTWIENEDQGKKMMEYTNMAGKDPLNQERQKNIDMVAHKVSSNLYHVQTSDNLGVPFGKHD